VTSYSQKGLELKIEFENPTQISREISDPDYLEITLSKPYFFARSLQESDSDDEIVLNKRLPRVYQDQYMEQFTEAAAAISLSS
jgi:hypothetical protein